MANKGFFIITDISGYTEYLTGSELDHANEILQSLFDAQLKAVKHPFILSGFRGDAIFMYVPETNFVQAQSMLEAIENFYIIFADVLQQMQYNTTCKCRACKNMSLLDLKLCVHYGEYLIQKLADREELLGADVIVPHRMLKNHVIEKTGIQAYALFSEIAAEKLSLTEYCESQFVRHSETYEHLGEVKMCVLDLRTALERERNKRRFFVRREDAWIQWEGDLPYPPALIWEFLTNPELEAGFLQYDNVVREDFLGGRVREDAVLHCAHGDLHVVNKIIDWKPFEYYSMDANVNSMIFYKQTRQLIPIENGTHVQTFLGQPRDAVPDETRLYVESEIQRAWANLGPFIEKTIAEGKVTFKYDAIDAVPKSAHN